MLRHIVNLLLWVLPPSRLFSLRRWFCRLAQVKLAENVSFCGRGWVYGRGELSVGRDTWISPGTIFHTHLQAPISIGINCDIGPGVEFLPGGHLIGDASRRAGAGTAKPISIGDGCWIGARSTILGGVHVGAGCVIAAGSMVTQDAPPNSLLAGVPARIKRQLEL
jgi:maltose O-acetyltransferase